MHHKYAWKALRVQWAQHQSANLCFDLYFERFPWKWEAKAYFGCQTTTCLISASFPCTFYAGMQKQSSFIIAWLK